MLLIAELKNMLMHLPNTWFQPEIYILHIAQVKTLVTLEDGKLVTLQTAVKAGQKSTK